MPQNIRHTRATTMNTDLMLKARHQYIAHDLYSLLQTDYYTKFNVQPRLECTLNYRITFLSIISLMFFTTTLAYAEETVTQHTEQSATKTLNEQASDTAAT